MLPFGFAPQPESDPEYDPWSMQAARTRARYPTRPPDPASLYASQGGVSWGQFAPSEERGRAQSMNAAKGEDFDPRDTFLSAIGVVGTPVMGPAEAGAVLGSGAIKGIRAYHGSPHDFERFDLSKIGTGEGAQAYGHGLYFAENPKVAQEYRDVLTRRPVNDAGISPTVTGNALFDIAEKAGDLVGGKLPFGPNRSLLTREQIVKGFEGGQFSPFDLSPAMQRQIVDQIKPPGRMYEVNINAQPEQFLDWDKPLTQQTSNVQDIFPNLNADSFVRTYPGETNPPTGQSLYNYLRARKGDAAAKVFDAQGIPGIKYLDQGSRRNGMANGLISQYGTPEKALEVAQQKLQAATSDFDRQTWTQAIDQLTQQKTSNYVLFRDDIIDIMRKYGLAGGAALPFGFSSPDNASQDMSQ
jgi:hypothetical protein